MATRYKSQTEARKTDRVIEKFGDGPFIMHKYVFRHPILC